MRGVAGVEVACPFRQGIAYRRFRLAGRLRRHRSRGGDQQKSAQGREAFHEIRPPGPPPADIDRSAGAPVIATPYTRSAEGQLDRLPALAAELVALKPDLIVALPAPATAAVKALTSDIPIVFAFVNDPIGLHFAASLNRPGGNLTGLSNFNVAIAAKRVELLREAFPDLHRLAIWQNSTAVNDSIELAEYKRAANLYGMEVLTIDARNPGEYEAAAAQSNQWKADGLCITSNPQPFHNSRIIIELAARLGKRRIY